MFCFLLFSGISADKTLSLPHQNAVTTYCSQVDGEIIEFFTPIGASRFLMTIVGISEYVTSYLYRNVLDDGDPFDPSQQNIFMFSNPVAKLQFNFVSKGCVSVASTEFSQSECYSGIEVVTKLESDAFYQVQPGMDRCIFFATASDGMYFIANESNLGSDTLTAFKTSIIGNYYIKMRNSDTHTSTLSTGPWLFRLQTSNSSSNYNESEPKGIHLYFMSRNGANYAIQSSSTPEYIEATHENTTISKGYTLPVFGAATPVIMLCSFIYTIIHLLRKPKPKNDEEKIEEVISDKSETKSSPKTDDKLEELSTSESSAEDQ